jgi:hypothetical protein
VPLRAHATAQVERRRRHALDGGLVGRRPTDTRRGAKGGGRARRRRGRRRRCPLLLSSRHAGTKNAPPCAPSSRRRPPPAPRQAASTWLLRRRGRSPGEGGAARQGGGEGEEGVARPALCFARARGCGFRAVRKGVPHGVAVVRVCADLRLRGQMSLRCACLGAGARGLVARLWGTGAGRRAARYRLALPAALAKRTERGRVFKSKTTALQHE